jgi:hypothetical protein
MLLSYTTMINNMESKIEKKKTRHIFTWLGKGPGYVHGRVWLYVIINDLGLQQHTYKKILTIRTYFEKP